MMRFVDNNDGTVTDTVTGLMWDQATYGLMTWEEAVEFCRTLTTAGHSGWRLPTVEELISILDFEKYGIAIDTEASPDTHTQPKGYWSSSTNAFYPVYAWLVYFYDGNVDYDYDYKSYGYYVRAVRKEVR